MADGPSHVDLIGTLCADNARDLASSARQMVKAGKDATESFSKGTSGIGDKIHQSVSKGTEKVKDVFSKAGFDASSAMSDAFNKGSGGIDDAAKSAGQRAGKTISDSLAASSSGIGQWAAQFGEQIGTKLGGAIGGALKDIPAIGGAADALQKVGGKAKEAADEFAKSKDQFKGLSDAFAGFNKDAPGLEGHLGKIGGILGQATGAVAAWTSLFHLMDKYGDKIEHLPGMGTLDDIFSAPEKAGDWLHDHLDLPTLPVDPRYKKPAPPLGTFSGVPLNDLTLGKGAGGDGYGALSGGGGPMGSSSDGYGALSGAKTSQGWFGAAGAPRAGSRRSEWAAQDIPSSSPGKLVASRVESRGSSRLRGAGSPTCSWWRSPYKAPRTARLRNDCSGMVSKARHRSVGDVPVGTVLHGQRGRLD